MAGSFSSLRANRKSLLDKIAQEAKKESQKQGADERFWKLSVDSKTSIGHATIRFLPAPEGEDVPWVRVWNHGFQIGGSWFIENCPTTIGQGCPVCVQNNKFWNSGIEADKDVARARKRKLSYISNVLVVDDPKHPENNGKVFLFRYGSKIHGKLMELIEPEFPNVKPENPFCMWEGRDFMLRSTKVGGFQNYDKSAFANPSDLGDDAKKEEIYNAMKPLKEFIAADKFKSVEELEQRFQQVLTGSTNKATKTAEDAVKQDDKPKASRRPKPAKVEEPEPEPDEKPAKAADTIDDVDDEKIKDFFGDMDADEE